MNLPPTQQPTVQTEPLLPHPSPGGRFGDFEILNNGFEGGMGVVYRARQIKLDRIVALKMIRGGFATAVQLTRFRAEAEAAASLDHQNIVPIYEVGEQQGQHYFAMKWIEGRSLADAIHESFPEAPAKSKGLPRARQELNARTMAKIARAVHHAHQRGIIHRDLKPANVLLDASAEPHVTDFGIARRLDTKVEVTATGAVMGTPSYMSPEQARGNASELTVATDIYSLGAVFYCMLTGRPPFLGDNTFELLTQLLDQEPIRPSLLSPGVDRDLETICLKCLEKSPARRYSSAAEFADDLQNWLEGKPIIARPVSDWERACKWLKRHSVLSMLAAAIAVSTLLGLAGITWQWKRAEKQSALTSAANSRLSLQRAEDLFAADKSQLALATLARLIRNEPTNRAAAERLLNALDQRVFLVPSINRVPAMARPDAAQHGQLRVVLDTPESFQISNLISKAIELAVPRAHTGSIRSIQFSPDGNRVITASADTTVKIWNAKTGVLLLTIPHRQPVNWAEYSPDGSRVLTATETPDASVRIWNATTGLRLEDAAVIQHLNSINSARFAPTNFAATQTELILTASDDRTARLWDGQTGLPFGEPVRTAATVDDAWFTSDGQQIILEPSDKKLEARRATHGTRLTPAAPGEGPIPLGPADESPELKTLRQRLQPRQPGEITRLVFNPAKNLVATGSTDKFARLWDAQTLELKVELPHEVTVNSVAFSGDGLRLATSTASPTRVRLWDVATGQPLSEWISVKEPVSAISFSPAGDFVISSAGWKWQLHPVYGKAPAWLADFAEAVGGVRYNSNGIPETMPHDSFERVVQGVPDGSDRLTDWLRELAGNDGAKTK